MNERLLTTVLDDHCRNIAITQVVHGRNGPKVRKPPSSPPKAARLHHQNAAIPLKPAEAGRPPFSPRLLSVPSASIPKMPMVPVPEFSV